ncbi:DNA methyltransferase, partial [Escherichia coli]|nr:DNA methyltransferase [Escherichia coli]
MADNLKFNKQIINDPNAYQAYDNYDAIEVPRTNGIPGDYAGVMGVPISFLDKYCPEQFEIIWQASGNTRASTPEEILEILNYSQHSEDRGGVYSY